MTHAMTLIPPTAQQACEARSPFSTQLSQLMANGLPARGLHPSRPNRTASSAPSALSNGTINTFASANYSLTNKQLFRAFLAPARNLLLQIQDRRAPSLPCAPSVSYVCFDLSENPFASCCAGSDLIAGFGALRLESSWERVDLSTGDTTNPRA